MREKIGKLVKYDPNYTGGKHHKQSTTSSNQEKPRACDRAYPTNKSLGTKENEPYTNKGVEEKK